MSRLTEDQIETLRKGTAADILYVAAEFIQSQNPGDSDFWLYVLEDSVGSIVAMLRSQESFMERNKGMFFGKETR